MLTMFEKWKNNLEFLNEYFEKNNVTDTPQHKAFLFEYFYYFKKLWKLKNFFINRLQATWETILRLENEQYLNGYYTQDEILSIKDDIDNAKRLYETYISNQESCIMLLHTYFKPMFKYLRKEYKSEILGCIVKALGSEHSVINFNRNYVTINYNGLVIDIKYNEISTLVHTKEN